MKKYNMLTVLREYKSNYPNGRPCRRFECICDCGNITNPTKEKVIKGETKSCGCLQTITRKNLGTKLKKEFGESGFNRVYLAYKKSAKQRKYDFDLSKEEFIKIVTKPCIYCGSELTSCKDAKGQYGEFRYTGIDRYDNKIGYTLNNSVPCCAICNRIKSNMDVDMLYFHLNKMIEHKIDIEGQPKRREIQNGNNTINK